MERKIICGICNKVFEGRFMYLSLASHVVITHKISSKEYYDLYIKKEKEGVCKHCGKPTRWYSMRNGYTNFCSHKCSANDNNVLLQRKKTIKSKIIKTQIKCFTCGNFFNVSINNKVGLKRKYCSLNCCNKNIERRKNTGIRNSEIFKGKSSWNKGKLIERTVSFCRTCGSEIHHRLKEHPKYCSYDCMRKNKEYKITQITNLLKAGLKANNQKLQYKGIFFRSSWEVKYAKLLDLLGVYWDYEKYRFLLSDGTFYVPDFYVYDWKIFIEVKGYWDARSIRKVNMFPQYIGNVYTLGIVDKDIINNLDNDKVMLFKTCKEIQELNV